MASNKPVDIKEEYHFKHTETRVPGQPVQHNYQATTSRTPVGGGEPITQTSVQNTQGSQWWPFRRAPVEEASIPQPRPLPDHDSYNEPTVMDKITERLNHLGEVTKDKADHAVHRVERLGDKIADKLHNAKEDVAQGLHHARDKVHTVAHNAKEDVREGLHHARDKAHHAKEDAREGLQQARFEAREKWDEIKPHHHQNVTPAEMSKEFSEGAELAKDEAYKRIDKLAAETHRKIADAENAAARWEKESRAQLSDAWESAKTHTDVLLKRHEGASWSAWGNKSFYDALKQVRQDNLKMQNELFKDVCDRHPQKYQCYKSVEKLMEVARDNTRINIQLAASEKDK